MINEKLLSEAIEQFGSPCYILDEACFAGNLRRFKNALLSHFETAIIGYSFKTNYVPRICEIAKQEGCYAEVVSRMELELAERLAFDFGKVIFNGPVKTPDDMRFAASLGAIINLDNVEQVHSFLQLSQQEREGARIGLRVNVDLSEKLLSKKLARDGLLPRFGMRRKELGQAVELLRGLEIVGLHGHASSSDRAAENYTAIANELLSVRQEFQLDGVQFLDVGGGFYGDVPKEFEIPDTPTYSDYASAIAAATSADDWFQQAQPAVVIEPGMSVIADPVSFVTTVVSVRDLEGTKLVGVDGNYFDIRPTGHKKILPHRLICNQNSSGDTPQTIVGATCMEKDILFESAMLPVAEQGDLIWIGNVGAYCGVLRPPFISYAPAMVSVRESGEIDLIQKRQDFDDFFVTHHLQSHPTLPQPS